MTPDRLALSLPPWWEVAEWLCLAVVTVVPALRVWPLVDRRSRPAGALRALWSRPGPSAALPAVLALCGALIVVEDVLDGAPHELFPTLDLRVHAVVKGLAAGPIRPLARTVSELTGVGLAAAVVAAALALLASGRRREGLALVAASVSAWALSGGLKLAFGIERPHSPDFGFPSGHALVTVVACGFLAWTLARAARLAVRRAAYAAAAAVAVLSAASRVLLGAHWFSDVVAGFCLGVVWLDLSILVAARWIPPPGGPAPSEPARPVSVLS